MSGDHSFLPFASKVLRRGRVRRSVEGETVHQDQRIGLALAILLVGAAGAFFFRNDPKPVAKAQRLKTAQILDARIEEMQNAPYLSKGDDEQESPRAATNKTSDRKTVGRNRSTSDFGIGSFPGGNGVDSSNPRDNRNRNASVDETGQDLASIPFPSGVEENKSQDGTASSRATGKAAPTADRDYLVQKGDTLSSIAAKELGSSGRFSEIFEANRETLRDANDLQVGMTLRIPAKRTARPEAPSNSRAGRSKVSAPPLLPADSNQTQKVDLPSVNSDPERAPEDGTSPKKKFEPVTRLPMGVQGMGIQSGNVDLPTKPLRKLSQLPPKDAGGKVAR